MGDLDDPTRHDGVYYGGGGGNPPVCGPWGDNITVTQAIELLGSLKITLADSEALKMCHGGLSQKLHEWRFTYMNHNAWKLHGGLSYYMG